MQDAEFLYFNTIRETTHIITDSNGFFTLLSPEIRKLLWEGYTQSDTKKFFGPVALPATSQGQNMVNTS